MEAKLFWKSVIRRKGSLLLLLALIAASTFGFTLRAVEYLSVNQEIARISREYRPIGSLTSADGMVTEGVSLVMESPYLELSDVNRYCPAILSDIYNADLDGATGDRADGQLIYGISVSEIMAWGTVTMVTQTQNSDVRIYDFQIEEGVYGYPDYIEPGTRIRLKLEVPEGGAEPAPAMESGKSYLVKGYPAQEDNISGIAAMLTFRLLPLEEGLWFREGEPDAGTARQYLGEDHELQERNRHAMMAVSTKDMTAMPLVQETSRDFYLEEGRWITREDNDRGNRVCVVSKEFADVRGLSVGDSLTMTFQDRAVSYSGYATAQEDTWESCDKNEETLEIVGIYGRMYGGAADSPGWSALSYRSNTFYVPDSCIPEHYVKGEIYGESFSFVLADPREKGQFLQEMEEKLSGLGISIAFVENNWDNFYQSARSVEQGGFYSLVIFTALLVLALASVVFLYTWQRRKECAIARALGVPAKRAAACACLPLLALSLPAVLAGGGLAWRYGLTRAGETLASLESGGTAELSWFWLAGILLLAWLVLALALLVGGLSQAGKQVLEVLQGRNPGQPYQAAQGETAGQPYQAALGESAGQPYQAAQGESTGQPYQAAQGRMEGQFQKAAQGREADGTENALAGKLIAVPRDTAAVFGKGISPVAAARFIGRHLRRFSLRPIFVLLAVVGFLSASCWLWNAIQSGEREIERLYRSTVVDAEITKKNSNIMANGHGDAFISRDAVQDILDTGFVESYTLIAGSEGTISKTEIGCEEKKVSFTGIADVEQSLSKLGGGIQIQYGEGFGPELFDVDYTERDYRGNLANMPAVFLPEGVAAELEVEPGELLLVVKSDNTAYGLMIGGVYTADSGMDTTVLMPLSFLEVFDGDNLCYLKAEFTLDPARNREMEEFRQRGREIVEAPDAGLLPLSLVIWDNELEQAIEPMEKNITLMKVLYPLTNGVSILAAIGLSILFLLQRRREAAILRVLGVGILPTRVVLALELLAADLAGLLAGAGLVALLLGAAGLGALPVAAGCYFLGCLVGIMAGAVLATRGRPLELLQEKE
ncbi:MAG: hypothetical protein HFI42_14910 [Lachnospiraceae bacterium]|nr:hypothetical protein [Lachnospiraceae bacterium]